MRVDVLAVGRLKEGPERALSTRYAERLAAIGRSLGLSGPRLVELSESQARRPLDRKADEAAAIVAALPAGAKLVLLDERGEPLDSNGFAQRLGQWRDQGAAATCFVIGGPDGLETTLRARADLTLAFGRLTLPHQLVRVLLFEQLYRAATILAGHPYHRD